LVIVSWCAVTNVVPSQATPSTQMAALMPDLNVEAESTSLVCTLQTTTMVAAIESMIVMIAASRPITGSVTSPSFSLMIVA
jgi:hypothetical protein